MATFIPTPYIVCTQAQKMRPEIPESLIRRMEIEVDKYKTKDEEGNEVPMKLYEVEGYSTKGELVRDAVRDKISEMQVQHLNDS
jgi:hypothetical protein